ncbi:MAG: hypothetical protein AAB487_03680 [Patescibacteria group bacterium]|mgnify:CR=1 FL=1
MASQIAHIIYAKKYFDKYPSTIDKDEFILGSIFPDMRRIDENIKRKDTHRHYDPLDLNFKGLTAFEAGWKFHLYCDMKREEILNRYEFYSLPGAEDFWRLPAKLLEDEIVYDKYNNWEKLVLYFNEVPFIETSVNVSRETFSLWYAILAKYIEKKPNSKTMSIVLSKLPDLVEKASGVVQSIDALRKNKKAVDILAKVAEEIV